MWPGKGVTDYIRNISHAVNHKIEEMCRGPARLQQITHAKTGIADYMYLKHFVHWIWASSSFWMFIRIQGGCDIWIE